jgi:acyl carrier protein
MIRPGGGRPGLRGAEVQDPEDFIRAALTRLTGAPGEGFTLDEPFTVEAGVDSLVILQVVAMCEEVYQVRIPDEAFDRLRTLEDLILYVKQGRPLWPR